MKRFVLCVFVGLALGCFADEHDYYLISGTDDKSDFYTGAMWRNADDAPASTATAGNRYWVNGTAGFYADDESFAGDLLAFGTPLDQADSPVPQDTYEAGDEGIAAHIIGKGRLQLGKVGCILIFR